MPQTIVACPFCRGAVTVVGMMPVVGCPHCHGQFPPFGLLPYEPPPDPEAEEARDAARAVNQRRQKAKESAAIMQSLGMGSMALALIGLVFAFIPVVSMFSLPVSGMGILIAVAGVFAAVSKKGYAISFPLAGLASNIVAILAALIWVSLAGEIGQNPRPEGHKSKDTGAPHAWMDASKPARQGDVTLRVTDVRVAPIILRDAHGELSEPPDRYLTIRVEVENQSAKKIPFEGWTNTIQSAPAHVPVLKDSSGAVVKRKTWPGQRAEGQTAIKTLSPHESASDLLIFEIPAAGYPLKLDLPASAFSGVGRIGFLIPRTMTE